MEGSDRQTEEAVGSAERAAAEARPVTLVASPQHGGAAIAIGSQNLPWPGTGDDFTRYWFVAVSRKDLSVKVNVVGKDESSVPPELKALDHEEGYMLLVVTNALSYYKLPTGDLHTFLAGNGGGTGLNAIEQAAEQAGSAAGGRFIYALFSIFGEPMPGFERWSTSERVVLVASVRKFGGLWTPVQAPAAG